MNYRPTSYIAELEGGESVSSSEDAYLIAKTMTGDDIREVEHLVVILLNTSGRVISAKVIHRGTIDQSLVSPREIYRYALLENAKNVIIAHNHPGGSLSPSEADIRVTRRVADAGNVIGVSLIDHIIFTENGWYSFAEEMPEKL